MMSCHDFNVMSILSSSGWVTKYQYIPMVRVARETNGETSPESAGRVVTWLPVRALSAATGSGLSETLLGSSLTAAGSKSDDEGKIETKFSYW